MTKNKNYKSRQLEEKDDSARKELITFLINKGITNIGHLPLNTLREVVTRVISDEIKTSKKKSLV